MEDQKLRNEIEELKREVVNTRNLSIKTDNLIANISHEIRAIEKTQEKILGKNLASTIFIYLFVFSFIFVTAQLIFQEKVKRIKEENKISSMQYKKIEEESTEMKQKLAEVYKREEIIHDILRLVTNGNYEESSKKAGEIKVSETGRLISLLLENRLADFKKDISLEFISNGKKLIEMNKLDEGRDELLKAKNSTKDKTHYATILFLLGEVERKLLNYKESNQYFSEYLQRYREMDMADDVEFLMAKNYENLNDRESANTIYIKFHEKYPKSVYNKPIKEMLKKREFKR